MRVNGYQCDACCTVNNGEEALKGWFAVYDFRKGVASDEQHFCSVQCLIEWAGKQMPVVEEVKPSMIEYANRQGAGPLVSIKAVKEMNDAINHAAKEYWRGL